MVNSINEGQEKKIKQNLCTFCQMMLQEENRASCQEDFIIFRCLYLGQIYDIN